MVMVAVGDLTIWRLRSDGVRACNVKTAPFAARQYCAAWARTLDLACTLDLGVVVTAVLAAEGHDDNLLEVRDRSQEHSCHSLICQLFRVSLQDH